MLKSILSLAALAATATLFAGCATQAAESPSVAAGRAIAERHCATCHAIADGRSPTPDAPPFAQLRNRYGAGGLVELLEKGMIKDIPRPLADGDRRVHPRMPAFPLGGDEVVALANYLRTFEGR